MIADTLTIAHAIPGRIRLRLPPHAESGDLPSQVSALEGVTESAWSPRTRGLLVLYDANITDAATIADRVATLVGVEAPREAHAGHENGATVPLRIAVPALFARANQRVAQATHGTLDLATGIPVALVAWAALELIRGRAAPLVWSSALWYAHGLFRDYNLPSSDS